MSRDRAKRLDRIVGILALLLLIDLLELPWYTAGGGTVSGIQLPSISNPATGSPAAILGIVAAIATLAVLLAVVVQYLSPDTHIPAIGDNRSLTRFLLTCLVAALLALKFILHLTQIANLGVGFWLAVPLTVALVYATMRARRDEPKRKPDEDEEDEGDRQEGTGEGDNEGAASRDAGAAHRDEEDDDQQDHQPQADQEAESDSDEREQIRSEAWGARTPDSTES